ncbi:MAG: hypothetical protein HFI03_13970 [Lachnospiraceae bacterium]|nr:hypothetical protein [Lachnospiraceae bacterium]
MARVKFEKGSCEWYMFQDYWKLCQKFWFPEDNNEYWDEVIKETNDFYKKYKEIELAENIALAFINTLAKISKKIMR